MGYGRPRRYEEETDLAKAVEEYFEYIKGAKVDAGNGGFRYERDPEPATITGLAYFLGFESRQSIYDYEKSGNFSYIVKSARLRVECEYEKRLNGNSVAGPIFALKNMGWADRLETDNKNTNEVHLHFDAAPDCDPIDPDDKSEG